MKKQLTSALAVAVIALGLTACGSSDRFASPGTYESESSRVDQNGTRTDTETTKDVSIDANGKKHVTTSTTKTKDPKGLLNKSSTSSTTSKTYEHY